MYDFIATATFGLEAVVRREVEALGFSDISGSDGRVDFRGGIEAIPACNLWLRSADRLLLRIGQFTAVTFDELFEQTKALPWDEWIPADGKFTVTGKSVKSTLFSVPDCQAIVKKAVVEKLKSKYNIEWFQETGAVYTIQVALLKDVATLTIDTTGAGLHKRGYRADAYVAPIKETLANALIDLSYWRKGRVFADPMCGSGTLPIEAALKAKNIAPGLERHFVSEDWEQVGKAVWKEARKKAYAAMDFEHTPEIFGYDIDPMAVERAKANARKAGVDDCIRFSVMDVANLNLPAKSGIMIANPPYGERIGNMKAIIPICRRLGQLAGINPEWSVYVITADEEFEKYFGRRADKKRKLYNGSIKTDYYCYFGRKPSNG